MLALHSLGRRRLNQSYFWLMEKSNLPNLSPYVYYYKKQFCDFLIHRIAPLLPRANFAEPACRAQVVSSE